MIHLQAFSNGIFVQLCSSWQDFNWLKALCGLSAIAIPLVTQYASIVCSQDEDSDRSQALAWALATFFRHIGYTGFKNRNSLDRCPYFNAKDRKIFKFAKAPKKVICLYICISNI